MLDLLLTIEALKIIEFCYFLARNKPTGNSATETSSSSLQWAIIFFCILYFSLLFVYSIKKSILIYSHLLFFIYFRYNKLVLNSKKYKKNLLQTKLLAKNKTQRDFLKKDKITTTTQQKQNNG